MARRSAIGMALLAIGIFPAWAHSGPSRWSQDEGHSTAVTADPTIALERLKLLIQPMDKDELQREATAWVALLKAKTQQLTDLQLAGPQPGTDSFQHQRAVHQLRSELYGLVTRAKVVVGGLKAKGGQVDSFEPYVNAIGAVASDQIDAGQPRWILDWLQSPTGGLLWARRIGVFALVILISWLASLLAARAFERAIRRVEGLSSLMRVYLGKILGRVVMAIGLVVAIAMLGVNIGPLVAAIGAGGFIAAFALQNTLSNFASGLMILIYRPFDVGDTVSIGGVIGNVREMSLVSTTLLTPDNQVVVIPNNSVWGGIITNVTGADVRRVDLVFGVGYGDDLKRVQSILEETVAAHSLVLKDPPPNIQVNQLADSSVNFICRPWVQTADYWTVYWDLMRTVKNRFDAEGITIPYPQRDVHMHTA